MRFHLRIAAIAVVLLTVQPASGLPAAGMRGAAATAHPAATDAAVEMLRHGGNATDAAVAAAFVLAVVEPYSSGLGGGGFALVRHGDEVKFLDFRETAPSGATAGMYVKNGKPEPALSRDGILAAAIPGAVAGYIGLLDSYGNLPRATVLAPAIRAAEKGFVVDERYRAAAAWRLDALRADPEASRIFLAPGPGGGPPVPPPTGALIVQKDLAATLKAIVKDGAKTFYSGPVALKLATDMKMRGGIVTAADLAGYATMSREPLVGSYRGRAVVTAPLPSSGGPILLTILNALEAVPRDAPWHDAGVLHLFIEASKRAFADRALMGDPAFVADPTAVLVQKNRALGIGPSATSAADVPAGMGTPLQKKPTGIAPTESPHTTHLCTIDAAGDAVSLSTTINYGFGSGVVARGTGVLWNDEMDDFAIAPGVPNSYGIVGSTANAVAPGKRPLSSMAPTLVFEGPQAHGPLRLVIGSPGGARIPTTVAQAIFYELAQGVDVGQALALGRIHNQHLPDVTYVEPYTLDIATRALLIARGHHLQDDRPWSNATAISIDPATGLRQAAADPRGVGTAGAQ